MAANIVHASDSAIESLEHQHARAESQIVENNFEGAVRTYSDILLMEPDDETAYTGLGNCYLVLGQYKKATEAYRNALAINPSNETAILGIQKIMDPDGVEGMIHPLQVNAESQQNFINETLSPPNVEASPVSAPPIKRQEIALAPKVAVVSPPKSPRKITLLSAHPIGARLERLGPEKSRPLSTFISIPTPKLKPVAPIKIVPISKINSPKTKDSKKQKPAPAQVQTPVTIDAVDAREIQKALRNTGFYSGPIDGVLGVVSRKAIKEYQILHELSPDGVVGPRTWASMRLYLDSE